MAIVFICAVGVILVSCMAASSLARPYEASEQVIVVNSHNSLN